MNEKRVILVIEDEHTISNFICRALSANDYKPIPAFAGKEGLSLYFSHGPDLVLLDLGLPDMDGIEVLQELSGLPQETPVIIISARDRESEKVKALDMGADDYIVKPFEVKELLARVHAVLRRTGDDGKPQSKKLTFDKLVINLDSYELIVDGKKIDTPPKEMELLYHLAATPNRVYTRNQLLDEVWGFDYFGDSRTVDVHIKRLREKLEGVSDKWALKTVWGVGYKFEAEET